MTSLIVIALMSMPAVGQVSAGFDSTAARPSRPEDLVSDKAEIQKKFQEAQKIIQQVDKRRREDPAARARRRRSEREARNAELMQKYDLKNKAAKQNPSSYEIERQVLKSLYADDVAMAESTLASGMASYPDQINLQLIRDSLPSIKQAQRKEERAVLTAELAADLAWLKIELKK